VSDLRVIPSDNVPCITGHHMVVSRTGETVTPFFVVHRSSRVVNLRQSLQNALAMPVQHGGVKAPHF
jgi:hypothetical protein